MAPWLNLLTTRWNSKQSPPKSSDWKGDFAGNAEKLLNWVHSREGQSFILLSPTTARSVNILHSFWISDDHVVIGMRGVGATASLIAFEPDILCVGTTKGMLADQLKATATPSLEQFLEFDIHSIDADKNVLRLPGQSSTTVGGAETTPALITIRPGELQKIIQLTGETTQNLSTVKATQALFGLILAAREEVGQTELTPADRSIKWEGRMRALWVAAHGWSPILKPLTHLPNDKDIDEKYLDLIRDLGESRNGQTQADSPNREPARGTRQSHQTPPPPSPTKRSRPSRKRTPAESNPLSGQGEFEGTHSPSHTLQMGEQDPTDPTYDSPDSSQPRTRRPDKPTNQRESNPERDPSS